MPTDTDRQRLYEVISERAIGTEEVPSGETLDEVESALAAVWEFLAYPVAVSVIRVANRSKANSITFDDIGRLLTWADTIRDRAEDIIEAAAKVAVVAHDAFALADGYDSDGTIFSDTGYVEDDAWFARAKRRHGFAGRAGEIS